MSSPSAQLRWECQTRIFLFGITYNIAVHIDAIPKTALIISSIAALLIVGVNNGFAIDDVVKGISGGERPRNPADFIGVGIAFVVVLLMLFGIPHIEEPPGYRAALTVWVLMHLSTELFISSTLRYAAQFYRGGADRRNERLRQD